MEDKQLAEYLRQYHLGEGGAATSRELERTFSVRGKELRDAVNRLRRRGIPIASSSNGYFYGAGGARHHCPHDPPDQRHRRRHPGPEPVVGEVRHRPAPHPGR